MYKIRITCRVCNSKNLTPLFSLGSQFVSDFVDRKGIFSGQFCPIELYLCKDCTLVQAKNSPPQDFLYTRHYWYRSGINPKMREALKDITRAIEERVEINEKDYVLDIGSNDGTLLRSYTKKCIRVGVEPARNLAEEGAEGVNTLINDFWSKEVYPFPKAKVITAIGMFYDLEDPNKFISDIADTLHPEGVFVAQLMCLKNMLDMNDLGNLAHEHLEFYSLKSLAQLFGKYGLGIFDIETNNVNGQSYRIWVCHKSAKRVGMWESAMSRLQKVVEDEKELSDPQVYTDFHKRMEDNKNKLRDFIIREIIRGKKIWVYGASTKGNVLLQYFDLTSEFIIAAADKSKEKWGKYTISTGIPIKSEEEFREANPDYALVLPYAFLDEFLVREQEWRDMGGKFIVPLPEFKVV